MSGTSVATPHIAGCAALAREYLLAGFYPTGVATPGARSAPGTMMRMYCPFSTRTPSMHFYHSGSACEHEYHVCVARPGSAADPSPLRQPVCRGPVGHGRDGRAGARDAEGPAAAAGDRLAPSGALVKALLLGGAAGLEGFEGDTGLPLAPPPSFRQGFGRVDLRRSLPLQACANPNPSLPASRASRLDPRICGRGARQGYASWAARRADGARRSLKAQAGAHRVAARNVLTRPSALRRSAPLHRRGPGRRRARAQGLGPR